MPDSANAKLQRLVPNRRRDQLFQLLARQRQRPQRQRFRAADPQDAFVDVTGELVDLQQQPPRVDLQIAQVVQVDVVISQQIVQRPPLALQRLADPRLDRLPGVVGHRLSQPVADLLDAAVRIADALPFLLQLDRLVA